MKTYDYDKQQWVDDDDLRLTQLRDEVALLKSPKGLEFAAFVGADYDIYLKEAEAALSRHLAKMGGVS